MKDTDMPPGSKRSWDGSESGRSSKKPRDTDENGVKDDRHRNRSRDRYRERRDRSQDRHDRRDRKDYRGSSRDGSYRDKDKDRAFDLIIMSDLVFNHSQVRSLHTPLLKHTSCQMLSDSTKLC